MMEVVVARYRESVEWASGLRFPSLVFNKNREDDHLFELNLPNMGRETDTFLRYLVDRYDSLPSYVTFLQGDPFDHCPFVVDAVNGFGFDRPFQPLGAVYVRDNEHIVESTLDWASRCGLETMIPLKFISGMQCIVSRELITMRRRESYERLLAMVSKELDRNCRTGYFFEYLWPTILGFNEEMSTGPAR